MTSPARSMSTVSPTRTSLRATSSSLCRLTLLTVTPASSTGSRLAAGVRAPVLPTLMEMSTTRVVACRAANLKAMAQRGARVRGEAGGLEGLQHLPVGGELAGLAMAHVVEEDVEWPRRRDGGILLPHRARRRVARIGEDDLTR